MVTAPLRADHLQRQLTDGDSEFIDIRLSRQQRLTDEPPLHLRSVIYEAALRNTVGGPTLMREQLQHILTTADLPNVSLSVVPFGAGTVGLDSPFTILSFTEPGAMDVVYMELPHTQLWIEGGEGTARYAELFETITRRALDERESLAFIKILAKEL